MDSYSRQLRLRPVRCTGEDEWLGCCFVWEPFPVAINLCIIRVGCPDPYTYTLSKGRHANDLPGTRNANRKWTNWKGNMKLNELKDDVTSQHVTVFRRKCGQEKTQRR